MLTTVNPGVFEAPDALAFTPVIAIVGFLAAAAFFVWGSAKAEPKSTGRNRLVAIAGVAALVLGAAGVILVVTNSNQYNDTMNEHRTAVRAWLASDYGIDITADETKNLIGHNRRDDVAPAELVVNIGGEPTSVKLIEGTGNTLQVKVVGGKVLQPRN